MGVTSMRKSFSHTWIRDNLPVKVKRLAFDKGQSLDSRICYKEKSKISPDHPFFVGKILDESSIEIQQYELLQPKTTITSPQR